MINQKKKNLEGKTKDLTKPSVDPVYLVLRIYKTRIITTATTAASLSFRIFL